MLPDFHAEGLGLILSENFINSLNKSNFNAEC